MGAHTGWARTAAAKGYIALASHAANRGSATVAVVDRPCAPWPWRAVRMRWSLAHVHPTHEPPGCGAPQQRQVLARPSTATQPAAFSRSLALCVLRTQKDAAGWRSARRGRCEEQTPAGWPNARARTPSPCPAVAPVPHAPRNGRGQTRTRVAVKASRARQAPTHLGVHRLACHNREGWTPQQHANGAHQRDLVRPGHVHRPRQHDRTRGIGQELQVAVRARCPRRHTEVAPPDHPPKHTNRHRPIQAGNDATTTHKSTAAPSIGDV